MRYLIVENSERIFNDAKLDSGHLGQVWRTFTSELLQQSTVAHFHDQYKKTVWSNDAIYAGSLLHKLRSTLISQQEIYHDSIPAPAALTGLGWCDALNGVAGRLLAHDFDRVEIVGVRYKDAGGHSFGRFWSPQYDDWLYFDIWTEEALVFRVKPNKAPEYLYRSRPVGSITASPNDSAVLAKFYKDANRGFVHNRLQSTVGAYFGTRIANIILHGSRLPQESIKILNAIAADNAFEPTTQRKAPENHTRQSRLYAEARTAHMLGDTETARYYYRQVAERDSKSVYGLAAKRFLERLSTAR